MRATVGPGWLGVATVRMALTTEVRNAAVKNRRRGDSDVMTGPSALVDAEVAELPAPELTQVGSRRQLMYLGLCLVPDRPEFGPLFPTSPRCFRRLLRGRPAGWVVAALTTVPVTLPGVFAPLAPILARRWATGRALRGHCWWAGCTRRRVPSHPPAS